MAATTLDPKTLSRIAQLQLRARRVVEGVLTGLHRSPLQGQAVEFAQHKEYAPGDEIRHIDWRAYARIDKHYVKKYEVETNLRAWLVLDASASMSYGGKDSATKLEHAKTLAAALSYLLVRQQDLCGLVVAGAPQTGPVAAPLTVTAGEPDAKLPRGVRLYVPPKASPTHLGALMALLGKTEAHGATDLSAAIDFVAEKAGRRAAVYVLSDLFDPSEKAVKSLARLRSRRCEVSVFHVLDRDELEFPFEDPTEFLSLESDARIEANPGTIRDGYIEELQAFLQSTRRSLREQDVEYVLAPTDEPLDQTIVKFLASRRSANGAGAR